MVTLAAIFVVLTLAVIGCYLAIVPIGSEQR